MIPRISMRSGDALVQELAVALCLGDDDVDPGLMDVCREFAFDSGSAGEFADWYLRAEVFSKFNAPGFEKDRKQTAMAKFFEVEQHVADVNQRLVDPWTRPRLDQAVWRRARRICAEILGRFPLDSLPEACRFGPGASGSLRRTDASHQKKWTASVQITEGAIPYHAAFVRWCSVDIPARLEVVDGNRVTTVPKSFKTDRTIAIEPDWNMFYQLGVGTLIRRRLQRFGLLQPSAQETNRALARLGSWTGSLATLDLSSASDSISLALCEALLPEDWCRVVFDIRSPVGRTAEGLTVTYEKVSSMGNGYTFELETLLFYCLVLAVCGKRNSQRVSVYGDDIICPSEHAPAVVAALQEAGFSTNARKSFYEGPFRESCGGHYWRGADVTPFYVRAHPTRTSDLLVLGNHLVRWTARRETSLRDAFRPLYKRIWRTIPRFLRGPYGMDGVLWAEWDQCHPTWKRRFQSYTQMAIQLEHRYVDVNDWSGSVLHKLWTAVPELQASRLSLATSRERLVKVQCDRDTWSQLPVRLA